MEPVGKKLTEVVSRAWRKPFTVCSNFARENAAAVAYAASVGLITSVCPRTGFPLGSWHVTDDGYQELEATYPNHPEGNSRLSPP